MESEHEPERGRHPLRRRLGALSALAGAALLAGCAGGGGGGASHGGGEADLELPDFNSVSFLGGVSGKHLLMVGLLVCLAGIAFGVYTYVKLRRLPVHRSMLEVSELIYQTCRAYLLQQGKFLLALWVSIATVILVYYAFLIRFPFGKVVIILVFSLLGMAGSYGVAWFGIRVNTLANSRTSFAALRGRPFPTHRIPLESGMSVGMVLISVELFMMLIILLFLPGDVAGACFIGFAIGESLGAAALRIAGGIFTKIADIGSDLMKIAFHIKEDDARNPGVIADCTGDNAGDSVGPSADGFETYGVTGVALITFILLAVPDVRMRVILMVWMFSIRIVMVVASFLSYVLNAVWAKSRFADAETMDFEAPLTSLVWITSVVSIALTYLTSLVLIGNTSGDAAGLWWKLATIVSCGTLAGALIPELVKAFTSVHSRHVEETVVSAEKGGASLGILSGLVAGNFSAYWLGIAIVGLMGVAAGIASFISPALMIAASIFAFGLVAFGFLGMGPVTIAVDSYGPVTDNAQSVYELSTIEEIPGIKEEIKRDYGFDPQWERAKHFLEENDGAGNTFKATAKPVLIGTAVVGATTMIFSILISLSSHFPKGIEDPGFLHNMSVLSPMFLLGIITGGATIYWFSGASMQAVTTGAYRAVEFIKQHIRLDGVAKASVEDSKKVVQICTQYAQKGMVNIFLGVFFSTLAFAFLDEYFFIGYLISIAAFGLYQAIFMANAGGAWDNAKKLVETDLNAKNTPLHEASIVGDTVGDPFKDTSSVSLNPVIKFSTLFGLLAVELGVLLRMNGGRTITAVLAVVCFLASAFFVYRSFYGMRIGLGLKDIQAAVDQQTHDLPDANALYPEGVSRD